MDRRKWYEGYHSVVIHPQPNPCEWGASDMRVTRGVFDLPADAHRWAHKHLKSRQRYSVVYTPDVRWWSRADECAGEGAQLVHESEAV